MGEVDPKTLAEASRRYACLRWMYWRFFVGYMVLFAVFVPPLLAIEPERHPVLVNILMFTLSIGILACILGFFVMWHLLMRFRCPRCGERFILTWGSSWPTEACKHCGLKLERDFAKPKDRDRRHFNDDSGLSL